jgi:hypothetical protein
VGSAEKKPVRYAELPEQPLTNRILAAGAIECDRCGSLVFRSPAGLAYHAKKCSKREGA